MRKRTPGPLPGTVCGACGRSKAEEPEQFRIRRRRGREALHYICKPCEAEQRRSKRDDPTQAKDRCTVSGCTRGAWARGWCSTHYSRWTKTGEVGDAAIRRRGDGTELCGFPGCQRPHLSKGFCSRHYAQQNNGEKLRPIRVVPDTSARDEFGRKRCTSCRAWQSTESFHQRTASADGLSPQCKRCMKSRELTRHFGITLVEYEELLSGQGGGCAICARTEEENGRMLAVDHDHACCPERMTCGRCRRGLLCSRCNLHLGAIGDRVEYVEAMATYLRSAQPRSS